MDGCGGLFWSQRNSLWANIDDYHMGS